MKNKPAGDTSLHQDQGPIAHKQTNYNQTNTIKTSQRKDILTTDLSYTNLNIKTTPSDNSLHLKVFSLLTKVPQLSLHFSYFVFQEPSIFNRIRYFLQKHENFVKKLIR
jgi:hypothetical protein